MSKQYQRVKELFHTIQCSTLCCIHGPEIDLCRATIELCAAINETETDETLWDSVGEFGEFTLGDYLAGSYWAFHEWSGGQNSDTYAAACAVGTVFSPGMTCLPDEEDGGGEWAAYDLVNQYFQDKADAEA